MAYDYYSSSKYLLDRGWLPSPSTSCQSAWQHDDHYVDVTLPAYANTYEPGKIRMPIEDACEVQWQWDENRRNDYLMYCSIYGGP